MIIRTGRKFYRHSSGIKCNSEYELLDTDRSVRIRSEDYDSYGYLLIDSTTNHIIAVPDFIFNNTFKEVNKR